MLDYSEPPDGYGLDDCGLLIKDPWWAFVYWEVTEAGLAAARIQLGPSAQGARLVLRLFSSPPPIPRGQAKREMRDVELKSHLGRRYVAVPQSGAQLRAAVGLLSVEGYFAPIAHSALQRVPPDGPCPELGTSWLTVQPARTRGLEREAIELVPRPEHQERGLPSQGFVGRGRHRLPGSSGLTTSGKGAG